LLEVDTETFSSPPLRAGISGGECINSGLTIDEGEPLKIAEFVKSLGIQYAVVTSVTRDDLKDGGAGHFRRTIDSIRRLNPDTKIEVLIPDFQGKPDSLKRIVSALPDVLGHNLETVERLYTQIRPQANYQLSLRVLSAVKEINPQMTTKSSIMLGLGETKQEVKRALADLRRHNCDMLTLGQYLAPSLLHYPVKEFIHPGKFKEYNDIALSMGFKKVLSGPRVRSSYGAEKLSTELIYA